MKKISVPKVKLPQIKLKKLDMSKINLRKFNWITVAGILAYLNILVLIPFFFVRKSPFVQYHVRQGLALLVVTVIFSFTFYLPLIPWIFAIFILICLIVGIANVATGRERPLPLIGKLAK
jgi:uncharacterized membrane protein